MTPLPAAKLWILTWEGQTFTFSKVEQALAFADRFKISRFRLRDVTTIGSHRVH